MHCSAHRLPEFHNCNKFDEIKKTSINNLQKTLPKVEGEKMIRDFSRFTQGWNAYSIKESGILIGDIRFAMLPDSARSLWSVYYGGNEADHLGPQITDVIMDRKVNEADWTHLKNLLLGEDKNYQKVN